MNKLLKFFTTVTVFIFLAVILIVYAFIPDPSGLLYNKEGYRIFSMSRNAFFYSTIFIFVFLQVIPILFNRLVLTDKKNRILQNIEIWFQGMRLAINLFFILMLIFIGLANNAVDFSFSSIHYLAYLAPSIVIVWLLTLPVFILMNKKE